MEDPTRIKNSFGVSQGKDDLVDANRIAEYAFRFSDKTVAYEMPDKTFASLKNLLHLAAVSAATHMKSSEYRNYYQRRTEEGKHPMCVLNIIRTKLVSRMFALIKRDEA